MRKDDKEVLRAVAGSVGVFTDLIAKVALLGGYAASPGLCIASAIVATPVYAIGKRELARKVLAEGTQLGISGALVLEAASQKVVDFANNNPYPMTFKQNLDYLNDSHKKIK